MLNLSLTFDGHRVRMVGTPDAPLWVAKDVCYVLGLHGSSNVARDVPEPEKGVVNLTTPGGPQPYLCVREAGLYRLIAKSRKPSAVRFQAWLFGEVLPSIRKHGCWPPPSGPALPMAVDLHDPLQLATVCAQALQLVAEYQPKAEAHDRLSAAKGDVCLQDAGRILGRQPNVFVATLLEDQILFRGAHGKPEPAHEFRERGLFRVRVSEVGGQTYLQTLVSPLGLQWLARRYPSTDGGHA
jgi:prophage antirepressor-like protein